MYGAGRHAGDYLLKIHLFSRFLGPNRVAIQYKGCGQNAPTIYWVFEERIPDAEVTKDGVSWIFPGRNGDQSRADSVLPSSRHIHARGDSFSFREREGDWPRRQFASRYIGTLCEVGWATSAASMIVRSIVSSSLLHF